MNRGSRGGATSMKRIITGILFASLFDIRAQASTVNVASCSQADVQNALNSASTGDMIIVPAGNCSWSCVSVNKAVVIQGAGTGQTNITLSGSHAVTMTKQVSGVIRLQGFTFSASGGGEGSFPFLIQGPWQNAQPIIIRNNDFEQNNNSLFAIVVAGGVVFSHNVFNGGWNDGCFAVKDLGNTPSWTMADSMGNRDTNGTVNLYIEDNTFYGHTNGSIDCDDNCRVVMRYNTFSYGGF